MCLIIFAYKAHPEYELILVANRDEFYDRPTSTAHWWEDHPNILGGRDLKAMGTWMAINKSGKFSALTNYRDINNIRKEARTRGELPSHFLMGDTSPVDYVQTIEKKLYNEFNLIAMNKSSMIYYSSYEDQIHELQSGVYGLSNDLLNTAWYKVEKAKRLFKTVIKSSFSSDELIQMMSDQQTAPDDKLPDTGLSLQMEKALSAMCISTPNYGTCCSTALTISKHGKISFVEKNLAVGNRQESIEQYQFTRIP